MKKKEKMKTKIRALLGIAIVLCSMLLVALPVIAAEQTTQKTNVSASTITTASEDDFTLGIYGNANMDDTIDMRDTTYTKLVIFGKKPKTDLADANLDGKVSMLDVGQMKLIILGNEKKLTLIDLADRTVTIDKPVERIVTGAYLIEEVMIVEGGEAPHKRIVGWCKESWTANRQWKYQKWKEKLPEIENIPDTGYPLKGTFNVEKVITLKTDLVIFSTSHESQFKTILEQLEQAGIPTICIDYRLATLETPTKSTLMLGYVLDKEERAQQIVDFNKEQFARVDSRLEKIDKSKPKVYLECGYKGPSQYASTPGSKTNFWGVIIDRAGGKILAEDVVVEYGPINPEYLLKENTDVIIISGSYWPATPDSMRLGYYADPEESRELLKAFTERPGWDTLNAVKNNRVYSIHHGIPGRIYGFVGVQCMAKYIYPDEFEDLDLEENFKEFHERFLPIDYSGVWMLSIEE